jgi:hypothetical protein
MLFFVFYCFVQNWAKSPDLNVFLNLLKGQLIKFETKKLHKIKIAQKSKIQRQNPGLSFN